MQMTKGAKSAAEAGLSHHGQSLGIVENPPVPARVFILPGAAADVLHVVEDPHELHVLAAQRRLIGTKSQVRSLGVTCDRMHTALR